jgi:hypothetical protein
MGLKMIATKQNRTVQTVEDGSAQTAGSNSKTFNQTDNTRLKKQADEDLGSYGSGSAGGKQMANLVLVTSITGFVHNVLLTTQSFYYLMNPKPTLTLRIIQFSAYFATNVRHAMNFLHFYFFNTIFRKEASKVFARFHLINRNRVQSPMIENSLSLNIFKLH